MSSFRSWNKTTSASVAPAPSDTAEASGEAPPASNPFGNMRRDRDRYNQGSAMSYSDWKKTEQKKKDDEKKERPLTEADFPPLSGKVVLPTKITVAGDGVNLADRIRNAIKRQEDEALRRRLELEEEEKQSKETLVSISRTPMLRNISLREVRRNLDTQVEEEDNYAWQVSQEVESPEQ
jgi:hypothetical protein